jgi:hypothetical protein
LLLLVADPSPLFLPFLRFLSIGQLAARRVRKKGHFHSPILQDIFYKRATDFARTSV